MCVSVAHGIAPVPPGAERSAAGGLGLSGPPGMAPGMNFASLEHTQAINSEHRRIARGDKEYMACEDVAEVASQIRK